MLRRGLIDTRDENMEFVLCRAWVPGESHFCY